MLWLSYFLSKYYSLNIMDLYSSTFIWELDNYNNLVLFIESLIGLSILIIITFCFMNLQFMKSFNYWIMLEMIWTIFPVLILIFLGFPSLKNLYITEYFNFKPNLSLKVSGHQWYWEYSFPEFMVFLNSYPKEISSLFRLGEADLLVLPVNTKIQALISSQDVIHSWAIPSLGFKMDACPGRLNYYVFMNTFMSNHIGQCSELCGAYHSWMPITIEFTLMNLYLEWMMNYL